MNPVIEGLRLDPLGRIVLSDEHLELIESHVGFVTLAGGSNPTCTNNVCPGSTNDTCSNSLCENSRNNKCYASPIE